MTTRIAHKIDLTLGTFEDEHDLTKIDVQPAADGIVLTVLKSNPASMDGRSNWLLFRLPNGDLIFGCYPEGDTYERITQELS